MATIPRATIDDLYRVPENGKAELVNGELVLMAPTGFLPSRASLNIAASLRQYERQTGAGYAFADNAGFTVNLPNRESFSPDAAFYTGRHTGMRFLEGAPVFAVEIRSENDYGPAAERALAEKRADYFAAGTLVVWDVDLLGLIRSGCIGRAIQTVQPSTDEGKSPRPSRPWPVGGCRSMSCLPD
jgi:Uma2 family endonuclease